LKLEKNDIFYKIYTFTFFYLKLLLIFVVYKKTNYRKIEMMKNFRTNTATTTTAPVTGRPVGLCSGVFYLK